MVLGCFAASGQLLEVKEPWIMHSSRKHWRWTSGHQFKLTWVLQQDNDPKCSSTITSQPWERLEDSYHNKPLIAFFLLKKYLNFFILLTQVLFISDLSETQKGRSRWRQWINGFVWWSGTRVTKNIQNKKKKIYKCVNTFLQHHPYSVGNTESRTIYFR